MTTGNRVTVGKLTSVYGIKGWVKVHSYTDPSENIFGFNPWLLVSAEGSNNINPVVIDDHRVHGKGFVAHIKGVDDRDKAALLCQQIITVEMGELPKLPDGEYYWQQLTGLEVLSSYGSKIPVLLGKISSLMETGANDILVVAPCENSIDQRERLLPYVDAYVLKVDLAAGNMLVDWDPEF
jgi:16S rRNA processing protein RimM